MVEVLVSFLDQPKFCEPTDAVGDWRDVRTALFEHKDRPTAVKYAIEKITVQLLHRELVEVDVGAPVLRYSGPRARAGIRAPYGSNFGPCARVACRTTSTA